MTTTHICGPCGNPDCYADHCGTPLTASAPVQSPATIDYEGAILAAGFVAPDATPTPAALTAGAAPPRAYPYTSVTSTDVGEALLISASSGEVDRATLTAFDVDSGEYHLLAGLIDAKLPAVEYHHVRRWEGPRVAVTATDTPQRVAQVIADYTARVLTAAANITPMGQTGRPVVAEPSTNPGPPHDPYNVLTLAGDDLISSLIRDMATYRASRNWVAGMRALNTLRDLWRAAGVQAGALADDGLTASAVGEFEDFLTAMDRGGHYAVAGRMLDAMKFQADLEVNKIRVDELAASRGFTAKIKL